ncbi:MAG: hypothetical protein KF754_03095 [Planctomycetes bacterium]|nr:hypothetical protein [Planctomycetota bacterium]
MHGDLDNLIRSAKPATNDVARQRVMAQVVPAFVPVVPTPWLRIAAALVLAAAAGFAAVAWQSRPATQGPDVVAELQQDLAVARARVDALNARNLNVADVSADSPTAPWTQQAVADAVRQALEDRDRNRREQHRERHLAYARRHYQQQVDAAVVSLRGEYRLSAEQEAEVRKVFAEHGTQVETLIGRHYRGGPRGRDISGDFDRITQGTQGKLETLLSVVPRIMPGADLAEWGPNPDFGSTTDYETWLNWNEQYGQAG